MGKQCGIAKRNRSLQLWEVPLLPRPAPRLFSFLPIPVPFSLPQPLPSLSFASFWTYVSFFSCPSCRSAFPATKSIWSNMAHPVLPCLLLKRKIQRKLVSLTSNSKSKDRSSAWLSWNHLPAPEVEASCHGPDFWGSVWWVSQGLAGSEKLLQVFRIGSRGSKRKAVPRLGQVPYESNETEGRQGNG